MIENTLLTMAVVFTAYLVRGITGFGSGLIAIPLLALHHPLSVVVPLVVILDFLGSAAQGLQHRSLIQWPELKSLLPFTLLGCLTALYLFKQVQPVALKQALGYFVLAFAVYQILPIPAAKGSRLWALPCGYFGGLIGTIFGTGGPLYMVYFTLRGLDKSSTRANFAAYFFVDGSLRVIGFLFVGLLSAVLWPLMLVCLPVAAVGLTLGGRVHTSIPPMTFKYFISLLLVFSGFKLISG